MAGHPGDGAERREAARGGEWSTTKGDGGIMLHSAACCLLRHTKKSIPRHLKLVHKALTKLQRSPRDAATRQKVEAGRRYIATEAVTTLKTSDPA